MLRRCAVSKSRAEWYGLGHSVRVGAPHCEQVTYKGWLPDGTVFDAATTAFKPTQVRRIALWEVKGLPFHRDGPTVWLSWKVIAGWSEALQLMCTGDKWQIYLP